MSVNASFASDRMMRLKFSQLLRFLSSNNSHRPLDVVITVSVPPPDPDICVDVDYVDIEQSPITEADIDFL